RQAAGQADVVRLPARLGQLVGDHTLPGVYRQPVPCRAGADPRAALDLGQRGVGQDLDHGHAADAVAGAVAEQVERLAGVALVDPLDDAVAVQVEVDDA